MHRSDDISELCSRFEEELRAGKTPDIDAYVESVSEQDRDEFREKLLEIQSIAAEQTVAFPTDDSTTSDKPRPEDKLASIVTEFELDIQAGRNRRLSEYLPEDLSDSDREEAISELVDRKRAALQLDGESISLDDMINEFPDDVETIHSLFPEHSEEFLKGTPAGGFSAPTEPIPDGEDLSKTSRSIGPYRLIKEIGQGGMGTVYLAEQSEPVRRKVALKVIRQGLESRGVMARFQAERQAMALMHHVNIATVYDAGSTESGLPYVAMEFVHGIPITDYCDSFSLTLEERINLIQQACDAVQHAHSKGIIHRDIKPSNVLVTEYENERRVKVIDFGLAKALNDSNRLSEETVDTLCGQVVGTLQYMSPEQASMGKLEIDTRTDVYSLGVVLYELLTGSTPVKRESVKTQSIEQVMTTIREEEPERPSRRLAESEEVAAAVSSKRGTDIRSLDSSLRGDLDWIAIKALEKDRTRRYSSPAELRDDLFRYLNNEPVRARPPSVGYRLGKFARKHRSGLIVATSLMLVAVLGIAGIVWQWNRAEHNSLKLIRAETQNAVKNVALSSGFDIPERLASLDSLPKDIITEELEFQFDHTSGQQQLSLAYALAEVGEPPVEVLIDAVANLDTPPDEAFNVIPALEVSRSDANTALQIRASQEFEKKNWRAYSRLAIVGIHLRNLTLVSKILSTESVSTPNSLGRGSAPDPRSVFIDELIQWHGDLDNLATVLKDGSTPEVRSAFCYGVASIDELDPRDQSSWQSLMNDWYRERNDSKTQIAAGWALREWGFSPPYDRIEFSNLIDGIFDEATPSSEAGMIAKAFERSPIEASQILKETADDLISQNRWREAARVAIVLMQMGDNSLASKLLSTAPDPETDIWNPEPRTAFIQVCRIWNGGMDRLLDQLNDVNSPDLRSGFASIVGGIPNLPKSTRDRWGQLLSGWVLTSPESGPHSASKWALERLELPIPPLPTSPTPIEGQDWWTTPMDLTMLRIPVGSAELSTGTFQSEGNLWMSDQEITVRQFKDFAHNDDPNTGLPNWKDVGNFGRTIDETHPCQQVSLEDAAQYCNWLSREFDLEEVYEIQLLDPHPGAGSPHYYEITLRSGADGFRLPTEPEWEYCCRTQTTTDFFFGSDVDLLPQFAVYSRPTTQPCGTKLCNAWGFFDLTGNVHEWCWGGSDPTHRIFRGGSSQNSYKACQSIFAYREALQSKRTDVVGFRVVRGPLTTETAALPEGHASR
ncbi:Serine/threonine-protein kinase PknB [Thalassoglobus neptunius]|uniref:Serine/threonine-protein kinase PknB n=1 Tax=Thalassoglobus neptunius TaxID=1938619 RepID=A0A5C5X6W0_9PLAN|nr:bifunctional serine/threonine-protein kinase/formylglycine-generating enzyme family protein [Thalassoglobus neptunius]TWT58081.1 Serine/threonine-protein kinase PknB [Thalassoglobus neptunius]